MAVYEINSLTIEKGTNFEETFKILNDDSSPLGINSSFSGVSKLRKHPKSADSYSFDLFIDNENSTVTISMASTTTAQLPITGRCYFDILLTYGYSEPTTKKYVKGTIIVQETISL